MYLQNQDQINEAKQRYLKSLNRVNLLLVRQHDLRKDEDLYLKQTRQVQKQIQRIKSGQDNSKAIFAQDQYLRKIIKRNQAQIIQKQKMMKGNETIEQIKQVKAIQQKYFKMMSSEFQSNIQQKLSMIRGKVDQLKKKIKQLNKQILSYEQEHLQQIDDYSLSLQDLQTYKRQNQRRRQQIQQLKKQQ